MIQRISVILLFLFSLSYSVFAANPVETLAPADSIRIKWMDGKKFILHKIEPKENWSSLSKKYNITVDDLKAANQGVEDLKIGQILNVPVIAPTTPSKDAEVTSAPAKETPVIRENPQPALGSRTPVMYTVKPGETLYSIAKRFEQKVEDIKSYNNLTSDGLHEGQKLIVRYITKNNPGSNNETGVQPAKDIKPVKDNTPVAKPAPASQPINQIEEKATRSVSPVKKANGGKTLMQVTETGVASWIQDGQINQDKYYGLHRTAPIGTIVKVTNRMNNQFVYVKIVGVLPDTGDNDNVIIKVSQAVSTKINALDAHYQVEISYGLMQ